MIKKLLLLVASLLFLVFQAQPSARSFEQHGWGASYFDWRGYELSRDSDFTQTITPLEISPYMYWAIHWPWSPSGAAYAGIQTYPNHGMVLFSLWDATASIPGPGVTCYAFGHEGSGHSCYKNIPQISVGIEYTIRIFPSVDLGDNWWGVELRIGDAPSELIGYIKAPLPNLSAPLMGNFIEYWGPKTSCNAVGLATARFGVPNSTKKSEVTSVQFSRPSEVCVNTWAEYSQNWYKQGPTMHFGGPSFELGDNTTRYLPHELTTRVEGGRGKISLSISEICSTDCSYLIEHNKPVQLTANGEQGYYFSRWDGDCSSSSTCVINLDRDKTVLAFFNEMPTVSTRWMGTQLKLRLSGFHKEDHYFLIGRTKSSKRITSKISKFHLNEVGPVSMEINGQAVWEGSFNLTFDSCKALRKVFKNGISKSGTFRTSSKNSTTPYPVGYKLNRHLDFNRDGFICD